ncbi:MAG: TIGR03118 family protein [Steroidobacteraceae bacterium]
MPPTPAASVFKITNLVSNSAAIAATHTDPDLVNAWGVAFLPTAAGWIANQGTSTSTFYGGGGVAEGPAVTIPVGTAGIAGPTGIVGNTTSDFIIGSGAAAQPSEFIFADLGGAILGWSPGVNPDTAVIAVDNGASGASYTGLALGHDSDGNNFLYAANFAQAKVDVFDQTFAPVTTAGGFVDVNIPQGYAPFGIQNLPASDGSAQIYVAYAEVDPSTHRSMAGAGLGFVDVFDAAGTLIKRVISGGALNAPWGIALAPSSFGSLGGKLLIGNFGDGTINAFDPSTGSAAGSLMINNQVVVIPGLWGIAFGNGQDSQPSTTLFFAAGPNNETEGVYGRIDFGPPSTSGMGSPPSY